MNGKGETHLDVNLDVGSRLVKSNVRAVNFVRGNRNGGLVSFGSSGDFKSGVDVWQEQRDTRDQCRSRRSVNRGVREGQDALVHLKSSPAVILMSAVDFNTTDPARETVKRQVKLGRKDVAMERTLENELGTESEHLWMRVRSAARSERLRRSWIDELTPGT